LYVVELELKMGMMGEEEGEGKRKGGR